jgi:N-methylhydantoinase A
MGRAVRAVTVERGRDPRDLSLVAMGGNGGIHAIDLARQLGIRRVIVPALSGVFSAVGMLAADVEHTHLKTILAPLDNIATSDLACSMDELKGEILARLAREGYSSERVELIWQADLRHEGQATELTVPFPAGGNAQLLMRERFLAEYLKTYGYRDETAIELVKIRLIGRGLRARRLDFAAMTVTERPAANGAKNRAVSFGRGQRLTETPIVPRRSIDRKPLAGPLIIDEFDATIVVPPDATVWRDGLGNIVMEIGDGS